MALHAHLPHVLQYLGNEEFLPFPPCLLRTLLLALGGALLSNSAEMPMWWGGKPLMSKRLENSNLEVLAFIPEIKHICWHLQGKGKLTSHFWIQSLWWKLHKPWQNLPKAMAPQKLWVASLGIFLPRIWLRRPHAGIRPLHLWMTVNEPTCQNIRWNHMKLTLL